STDPMHPCDRTFVLSFTSSFVVRVSDAFPEGAPFDRFQVRMGSFPILLSRLSFTRFELGDRAIEPVYPAFFTTYTPPPVFYEQALDELTAGVQLALLETKTRSPIER